MAENTIQQANRLEEKLRQLSANREKALTVFLMGGDPDRSASLALFEAAVAGGADILEIGVPFSDPLADGPVNQKAARRALLNGINIHHIFDLVEKMRGKHDLPLILLLYYNTVYQYGIPEFFRQAREKGVDALIIPDLPFEEMATLRGEACRRDLILINMLAPTTGARRMKLLLAEARGFVYCVSLTGVTGVRKGLSPRLVPMLRRARSLTGVPLFAGFGISTPEQAREAVKEADGVIVGSSLVAEIEKNLDNPGIMPAIIREKVSTFKQALRCKQ